jgi:Skp family chaperone for outer membrane proteins
VYITSTRSISVDENYNLSRLIRAVLKEGGILVIASTSKFSPVAVSDAGPGLVMSRIIPIIISDSSTESSSSNKFTTAKWKSSISIYVKAQRAKSKKEQVIITPEAIAYNNASPDINNETEYFIRQLSSENDVVFDPLMDRAAITGMAAVNLGRRFIGIAQEPKTFEAAKLKLETKLSARNKLYKIEPKIINFDPKTQLYDVDVDGNRLPLWPETINGEIHNCLELQTKLAKEGPHSSHGKWTRCGYYPDNEEDNGKDN